MLNHCLRGRHYIGLALNNLVGFLSESIDMEKVNAVLLLFILLVGRTIISNNRSPSVVIGIISDIKASYFSQFNQTLHVSYTL